MKINSYIHNVTGCRRKGGTLYEELNESIRIWNSRRNTLNFLRMIGYIAEYFGGKRVLGSAVWSIIGYIIKNFLKDSMIVNADKYGKMYHWTPMEKVDIILNEGIKSNNGVVYITDNPDYLAEKSDYLKWKTFVIGRSLTFVLLEVDTRRLSENHTITTGFVCNHLVPAVFTVDYVPKDCIKLTGIEKNTIYGDYIPKN